MDVCNPIKSAVQWGCWPMSARPAPALSTPCLITLPRRGGGNEQGRGRQGKGLLSLTRFLPLDQFISRCARHYWTPPCEERLRPFNSLPLINTPSRIPPSCLCSINTIRICRNAFFTKKSSSQIDRHSIFKFNYFV